MRWHRAAWAMGALLLAAGCVEDAQPTLDRDTRRLDGGRAVDAGSADRGPDAGAADAASRADARSDDAAAVGPDAGCSEGASAERDCPEGGTQSRRCGPAGWEAWTPCPTPCPDAAPSPIEVEAVHGDVVELSGLVFAPFAPRPSGPYDWVALEGPSGPPHQPVDHFYDAMRPANGGPPDDRETPEALWYVGPPGRYVIALFVGGDGRANCAVPHALLHLQATPRPTPRMRVTLAWRTDGDADPDDDEGADLDLHLLHPSGRNWFSAPPDCYGENPAPDWGEPGPRHDPALFADERGGAQPEVITLPWPEETGPLGARYCVGVHVFSLTTPDGELGPTHATVQVFEDDGLLFSAEQVLDIVDQFWTPVCVEVTPDALVAHARGDLQTPGPTP
ncbi:MAG: hypothetical protein H6704_20485 [Myxococcales bacterium]|nr:hypothetical protein [Myxococcales bacterium]